MLRWTAIQVFMNICSNAIDALEQMAQQMTKVVLAKKIPDHLYTHC